MTEDKNLSAWKRGTQEVEEIFARFESVDGRRRSLVESIQQDPENQVLRAELHELNDVPHIQRAARRGIFISYARHDEIFALDVSMILMDAGLSVWLDVVNGANEDWSEEIHEALERCGLMAAIHSPHALDDPDVSAERQQFIDDGKLVLPIYQTPYPIDSGLLWLDPIDFSEGFEHGIERIHELLVQPEAPT